MTDTATAWLLAAPVLLPFFTALFCLLLARALPAQRILGVAGTALTLAAAVILLVRVDAAGVLATQMGAWEAPLGITLVADRLSAIMVCISGIIGCAVAVFSARSIDAARLRRYYFALYNLLLMGINGAFLTGDLFNLFVWFEVMLIASFVLLALGNERPQLEGAIKYVVLNLISSAFFLVGVGLLYGKLGTLNMADIALKLANEPDSGLTNTTALLLFGTFALKAGLFPLFFWLPASYHTPPPAVSAIFAGMLTKVGIYAVMRLYTLIFAVNFEAVQPLMLFIAGATMLTGVLGAASFYEMRRILSFHIVSQLGYIFMGFALMSPLALASSVFYLIHHILVKTNLFLVSGIVVQVRGTGELARLGGLYRAMPLLSILFLISALSLGGIPPLSGFWAKLGIVRAGLESGQWLLTGTALFVGVLTLFSMIKIWAEGFLKAPANDAPNPAGPAEATDLNSPAAHRFSGAVWLYGPAAALAACTLVLSFFGGPFFDLSIRAAEQLLNPAEYINAVLGDNP